MEPPVSRWAEVRWHSTGPPTRQPPISRNTGSAGRLREIYRHRKARDAFVTRTIHGRNRVPIALPGLHRIITMRGRRQEFRGEQRPLRSLLLAAVHPVARPVGL